MNDLLLTIAANIAMIFVMRHSESHSGNRYAVTVFNYMTGVAVTLLLMGGRLPDLASEGVGFALGLSLFNAACMVSCMLLVQFSILKNGAPLSTTFNRLGILIPTVLSILLFREKPGLFQAAGLGLAVFAIVYLGGKRESDTRIASPAGLFLIFLIGGLIDFNSKVYNMFGSPELQKLYVLGTFIFSLGMSAVLLLIKNRSVTRRDVLCGVLVGLPNQLVSYCMVRAAAVLPAYIVFPVYSSMVILGVNLINFLVFREKPGRRELYGTAIIALAVVLISC